VHHINELFKHGVLLRQRTRVPLPRNRSLPPKVTYAQKAKG
jgi:hypothetical protein